MTAKNNPRSPVSKIRLENRAGKAVTVISGLHTYGSKRLDAIARELKTTLGTGGTVKNGTIEIQGDKVELIKNWFAKIKAPKTQVRDRPWE
jgi:predicted translation initiation factor SUI1